MLFEALKLGKRIPETDTFLFKDLSFKLDRGEIIAVRGPSGCGKSTLLKCLAQLILLDEGKPFLLEKTPESWGVPSWRSKILYVPQRPPVTSGTPLDFFKQCRGFSSRSTRVQPDDPVSLGEDWGLPPRIWHEEWSQCSGGEAQRAMLAIAIALKPDILLLDEPTSALDEEAILLVEKTLRDRKLSALWITHSEEQEKRVAARTILLGPREGGGIVHSRNTSGNFELDGDADSISSDSVIRKKRSGVKRTRSREHSNKGKP